MVNYVVSDTTLTSLADTIRAKGNTSALLEWPQGYNVAINAINPLTLSVNASGPSSIVSVNDATDLDAKQVVVAIELVQAGSGDPSPTNVRPISGWTGAQVTRTGKNLFDVATYPLTQDKYVNATTGMTVDTSGYSCTVDFIPFDGFDGEQITLNKCGGGFHPGIAFYSSASADGFISGKNDNGQTAGTPITFTVPSGTKYIRFAAQGGATDIQLELGSTATAYEPYTGETYSVTFPTEAGTVYGGTLDVTAGKLTVDRAMVTFNGGSSEQWWLAQDYTNRFGNNNTGTFCDGIVEHQISNWLKSSSWGNKSFTFGLRSNGSLYICLDASAEQITEAQFRAYLASTPLQIVYTLATPVTYDLTPQDIKLLSGYNVIFADCGDVALSYYTEDFADLADEIDFAEGGDY